MKEDGGMERFASLVLTLALVAAATAAVRWLVSGHKKKAVRTESDATDAETCPGWLSATGSGSRELQKHCQPRGDRRHSDNAAQQTEGHTCDSSLRVPHALPHSAPSATEGPGQEDEHSPKYPYALHFLQKGTTTAGVLALEKPFGCDASSLDLPSTARTEGPGGDPLPKVSHCHLENQEDSLFFPSVLRMGRQLSQSHVIDNVVTGSDGDRRVRSQGNSESRYSPGNASPAAPEASLDTVHPCNGKQWGRGETLSGALPPLVKESDVTSHTRSGLQEETLSSFPGPRRAGESQCQAESSSQAVPAVPGSMVFVEGIIAGTSCDDRAEGNLCAYSETGLGSIPEQHSECVGSVAANSCTKHTRNKHLTCLKVKYDIEESDNGATELDRRRGKLSPIKTVPYRQGQTDLLARNETTSDCPAADRAQVQTAPAVALHRLQGQGSSTKDETCPTHAPAHDALDRALDQVDSPAVGHGHAGLVQSASKKFKQEGPCVPQGACDTGGPSNSEGHKVRDPDSPFGMHSGLLQLDMPPSHCQGLHEERVKNVNVTAGLHPPHPREKEHPQGKPTHSQGSVTSKVLEAQERAPSHMSTRSPENMMTMSIHKMSTIDSSLQNQHESFSPSTLSSTATEEDNVSEDRKALALANMNSTNELKELDRRNCEMDEQDRICPSCTLGTGNNPCEGPSPAETSACHTKEGVQAPAQNTYPEVLLPNATFVVRDFLGRTGEVFEHELCNEAESPGNGRKDNPQQQEFTWAQDKEAVGSPPSQLGNNLLDTHKAEDHHSANSNIVKESCDSSNIKYETLYRAKVTEPDTAQMEIGPVPSHNDPFISSSKATTAAARGAECAIRDNALGLASLLKSSTWSHDHAVAKPTILTAFEEPFTRVSPVIRKNPTVDQRLDLESVSVTELRTDNVLSPSSRMLKCISTSSLPKEEDSLCSTAKEKALPCNETLEGDHKRGAPISNSETDHCGTQPLYLSAVPEAALNRRPAQINGHSEEKRQVEMGVQDISQIKRTRTGTHNYNVCSPDNFPKLFHDKSQVSACDERHDLALEQHKEILVPTRSAVWENHSCKRGEFEASDIRRQDAQDKMSGSESQTAVHEANPEVAPRLSQKLVTDISVSVSPRVSESVTATMHSVERPVCNSGSNFSCFQEKKSGKNVCMCSQVSNEDPSYFRGAPLQGGFTLGTSIDAEHDILSPLLATPPGVNVDHNYNPLFEEEEFFNNVGVATPPERILGKILRTQAICSEEHMVFSTGSQVAGLRNTGHKCSLGLVSAETSSETPMQPGTPSDGEELSNEEKAKKQLNLFPKYTTVQSKYTEGLIGSYNVPEKQTSHKKNGCSTWDADDSLKDDFELETMLDGAYSLSFYTYVSDSGKNQDSESSESGYTTENTITPAFEERSWSSLGTEGEQPKIGHQDLQVTLSKAKSISDSAKTFHQQENTESTGNYKYINTEGKTNIHDNFEKKNYKNKLEENDCDKLLLTLNHTHAFKSRCMHIDEQNHHFEQPMRVKPKDFNNEIKQSCKPSPSETVADSENMMFNMSLDEDRVSEKARDQCHECNEAISTPEIAGERENISTGEPAAVRHGQRTVEDEHKKRNGITTAGSIQNMHPPDDSMHSHNYAAEFLGTVTQTKEKTENLNWAFQIEPTGNNIQICTTQFEDIFSQRTLPQTANISECPSNRYVDYTINDEKSVNNKNISPNSHSNLEVSSTKSQGLVIGKQCHDLSKSSGQTMSLSIRSNQRIVGKKQLERKKTDKDNKSFLLDSTVDVYASRYRQTKDLETMNNVTRDNEIKSHEYFHDTSSSSTPSTRSLPSMSICQKQSTQQLKSGSEMNSKPKIDKTRQSEHQITYRNNLLMPFNIHAEMEAPLRSSVLQRRGSISEIAENPELRMCGAHITRPKTKLSLAKSCEDILSDAPGKKVDSRSKTRSMLCLLTEHYSLPLSKNQKSPVEYVAKGSFLNIPETLESTEDSMKMQLHLGNCLELLTFAKKNRASDLQEAAYTVMSDNYLQVLRDPAIYGQLNGGERDRILQLRTRGKNVLGVADLETIYGLKKTIPDSSWQAVNEFPPQSPQQRAWLYTFEIEKNSWQPLTQIPEEANLKGCSICSMNNYLFLAGGIKGQGSEAICSNKVFCYNPLTEIWRKITPMNQARSQLKLVSVDGYLYAIGGECLYTVERYDPRLDKWMFKASLPKGSFAVAHEATTCNGDIYVSGGNLFYRLFKYTPLKDVWEECPYNTSRKRSCDMVAIRSFIYRFDIHRESGVSVFKYNTTTKAWNESATLCLSNPQPFRCVVLDGTVYCLNKNMTVRFTADDRSQRFEPGGFRPFSEGSRGALCPFVLTMPQPASLQTSV